jgi:NAD(P)-dependent dehydrogenase (short-subunit alcohol dehydrogenase family)
MKTIFITGASSGIGKATAEFFAQKGWRVIATMRNIEKGADLEKNDNIVVMPLDVTNSGQIKSTCQEALAKYDVDVLFNNAGYGIMAPLERIPESEIRKLFDTDVIGTMLVTQEFIPHFKKRKSGAILSTTSLAGVIAFPRDGVYGAAKRAVASMMESLYYELKPFNVVVKTMIPGGTKTNFQVPLNILDGYESAAMNQYKFLLGGNEDFPGPDEAAETVWTAVSDGEDIVRYPTDRVCRKLYDDYINMGYEDFKRFYSDILFK